VMRKIAVDADRLGRTDCCRLAQWMQGSQGQRHSHTPAFRELVRQHGVVHSEAARVGQVVNQRRYPEAQQLLESGTIQQATRSMVGVFKTLTD